MSGAHEGCSHGKSVRDREGSKHSTAAALERVDSEAAVLPQDFEDTVHARQLKELCRRVGRRMSRQGPGRSPSIGLTHLNAARPREKVDSGPALLMFCRNRFTLACKHVAACIEYVSSGGSVETAGISSNVIVGRRVTAYAVTPSPPAPGPACCHVYK